MEKYFYLNSDNAQVGPVSPADFSRCGITANTMVWKQGMAKWAKAGQIAELSPYFNPIPPSPAPSSLPTYLPPPSFQPSSPIPNKPTKPNNHMVWAVLVTLFCSRLFGLCAIVQASQVNNLYNCGRYMEAQEKADSAKKWIIVAVIIAAITFIIGFIIGWYSEL